MAKIDETIKIMMLKGEKGDTGEQGIQGVQGIQGEKGDAFLFEDFTAEQIEELREGIGDNKADKIEIGLFTGDADSLDDVPVNSVGWISNEATNNPVGGFAIMETWGASKSSRMQRFTTYSNYTPSVAYRLRANGTWSDLFWDNPPMVPGIEYRTTRRYNNSTVYAKLIRYNPTEDIGKTSGNTDVNIPHEISGMSSCVEIVATCGTRPLPVFDSNNNSTSVLAVGTGNIILRIINRVWTAGENIWSFTLYYTKTS